MFESMHNDLLANHQETGAQIESFAPPYLITKFQRRRYAMDTIMVDEQVAIKASIDAWINAVEIRDIRLLPQVVTQEASSVWIGPGAGEWLAGYEALEQAIQAQNEALHDIHIEVSEETIHVSPRQDMAWATNRWVFNARMGDQALALPLRCTWILEKPDDHWIIVHFHKSAELPG